MAIIRGDVIVPGYCNHVDSTTDSIGNLYIMATHNNNGKIDCIVKKRAMATGAWTNIHTFDQDTYGKHGYSSIDRVGRHLVCILSERQEDDSTALREYIITDVCDKL